MAQIKEIDIQNSIRLELSNSCIVFRANVGTFSTADGRMISTGLPKGFSDLFGFRISDGKAFFIEVKTPNGKVRPEQDNFIKQMRQHGALAAVCRSVDDALTLIGEVT